MDIKPDLNPITATGKTVPATENPVLTELRLSLGGTVQGQLMEIEPTPLENGQTRWTLLFQILGRNAPLTVQFTGTELPEGMKQGSLATLEVNPLRGLNLVSLTPPQVLQDGMPVSPVQQALLQSLTSLLPRQGQLMPLLRALQTLATPSPLAHSLPQPEGNTSSPALLSPPALPLRQLADVTRLQAHLQQASGSLERSLLNLLATQTNRMPLVMPAPNTAAPANLASAVLPENTFVRLLAQVAGIALKHPAETPVTPPPSEGVRTVAAAEGRNPPPIKPNPILLAPQATGRDASPASEVSGQSLIQTGEPLPGSLKATLLLNLIQVLGQPSATGKPLPGDLKSALQWLDTQLTNQDLMKHPLVFPSAADETSAHQPTRQDSEGLLKSLLQLISRLQVHQLNSQQQTLQHSTDPGQPQVWLAELPIQSNRLHTVQMRVERESAQDDAPEAQKRYRWTIVLAFNFEQVGHFQTRMRYSDGTVSAIVWAEQPDTLKTIHEQLPTLREGLKQWGLTVGGLDVRHGRPSVPSSPIQRQMIDERA